MKALLKTVSRIKAVRKVLSAVRTTGRIGLIPTMGAFHEGHLTLMRRAKRECDFVVVSLFVNPAQFGPKEDYIAYPRTIASDQKMAKSVGVDMLWTPLKEEIYPVDYATFVEVGKIGTLWEGRSRPGHFQGVATVVMKLFGVVQPDIAYFGAKDYQQTRVIKQMMHDFNQVISLRILPTVRERDGLAMSSRNVRLSPIERAAAPILYRALKEAKAGVKKGERRVAVLLQQAEAIIRGEPLATLDYVAICDPETLMPVSEVTGEAVFLATIKIGTVRLIDNIQLTGRELRG